MSEPTRNEQARQLREKIHAGVRAAVARAIEEHRKAGRSIVIWRDGKIVVIPPEEIKPLSERE
jgi:hypothetical protein